MTPNFETYRQIPVHQWKVDWTKAEVDEAILLHEQGQFSQSAMLMDAMTRDDAVSATLMVRVLGGLGLPRKVEAPPDADRRFAPRVARMFKTHFETLFPTAVLAQLDSWARMMGFAVAQIVWEATEDEWKPRIDPWHPAQVQWRFDTQSFWVTSLDGLIEVKPGTGQWLLYTPFGESYGWMHGLVRSLAEPWLARRFGWRDWVTWSEQYSKGIRKAKVPGNAKIEDKKRFLRSVSNMGSNPTVLCQKGATPDQDYDLETEWPDNSGASAGFESLLTKTETKIAVRTNGQNLTTENNGGSYALGKIHSNVKQDLIEFDERGRSAVLERDVAKPYCRFHYPQGDAVSPCIGWVTAPPEDQKLAADTMSTKAGAVASLASTSGVVTVNEARAMLNPDLPPLEDGDRLLAPQQAMSPMPDGTLPYMPETEHENPESSPVDDQPAVTPTGTETTRLSVTRRLARRAPIAGQLFADRMASEARDRAVKALAPDLDAVLEALSSGESYEDIRKRLEKAHASMNPDDIADIVEDTLLAANLAGRYVVKAETNERQ